MIRASDSQPACGIFIHFLDTFYRFVQHAVAGSTPGGDYTPPDVVSECVLVNTDAFYLMQPVAYFYSASCDATRPLEALQMHLRVFIENH